jgi:methionyl-tRNA formyltransferase
MKSDLENSNKSLRVGFIGSHILSWFCLKTIAELCLEYGDELKIVFNLEPNIGNNYSAYQDFNNLDSIYPFEYIQTNDLDSYENIEKIKTYNLDILFIIGWHKIVSRELINSATFCMGMHTSLLPKNRGSAPVNWQIIRNEKKGGITLFHLSTGVDTGDIISQKKFFINKNDTCKDIHEKSILGAIEILREEWLLFKKREVKRIAQNNLKATTNARRRISDGKIIWDKENIHIDALIRATTSPYPGAFGYLDNKKLLIWSSRILKNSSKERAGTIIKTGKDLIVSTGNGCIKLLRLNYEGEPECNAELFSLLYKIKTGMIIL